MWRRIAALRPREGIEEVPVWVLGAVLVYAGVLLFAALWAIVERARCANLERRRRLPDRAAHQVVAIERTSEGSAPTSPTRA